MKKNIMLMIDPPIPARFEGIGKFAREHGWHLTLANRLVRTPRGWSGDGALVTLRNDPSTVRFTEDLMRRGIPVVDLTFHRPDITIPRVIPDYTGAGRLAARHFITNGIRRTAWFSTEWSNVQKLFFKGLCDGMAEAHNPQSIVERFVLTELVPKSRLDDPDCFESTLSPRLLALRKPLGILAYNDEEASRVAALCIDIGIRIPEEIAIMGIGNDVFLCENQAVPISSVDDELERTGYDAAALLQRLMDGETPPHEPILTRCRIVIRRRSTNTFATENPIIGKALSIFAANLDNPPSMVNLARRLGVSRATLDRLFIRELGMAAHSVLLRQRLEKSKEMLLNTGMNASEISAVCGFCNPAYFSAAFKRSEGVTPGKWRKR